MAGIKTPGVDVDVSWPLVAGIGVIAALVIWVVYEVVIKSGVQGTAKTITGLADSVANGAKDVTDGVGTGISTLLGTDKPPAGGGPSNSELFYSGISNFFKTGSIYDSGN